MMTPGARACRHPQSPRDRRPDRGRVVRRTALGYDSGMATEPRIDSASRVILASPRAIYQAFLDPECVAKWRPPAGMKAKIFAFEPRIGGGYRMAFIHEAPGEGIRGKSSEDADIFTGRFAVLEPYERIVEEIEFQSDDPIYAGTMRITTTLTSVADGTKVSVRCENVPPGISPEDHQAGIASSLKNLANFVE